MATAHERIRAVLDAHGITAGDIEARIRSPASLGRPVSCDLHAVQFGSKVVAAMLELVVERLTESRRAGT
jgi:hypothetical protein